MNGGGSCGLIAFNLLLCWCGVDVVVCFGFLSGCVLIVVFDVLLFVLWLLRWVCWVCRI